MNNLSFKEYLLETEEKRKPEPEYQDLASRILGIEPKDREKQVYVAADVQDGRDGYNLVPMVMGKATVKNGKVIGNKLKMLTNLKGNRSVRKFTKQGEEWVDMGRELSPNRNRWLPVDVVDKWINQGAEGGGMGGMGMGGGPPGL